MKTKRSKFQTLQSQISTVNILDSSRSSFLSYASRNKKIFDIDCLLLRSRVQISQIRGKKITNLDTYVEEFVESSPVRSNETEKGEENNIENVRSALLRDEAVNTSKTQISLSSF